MAVEAAPPSADDISAVPSLRDYTRREIPASAGFDDEEEGFAPEDPVAVTETEAEPAIAAKSEPPAPDVVAPAIQPSAQAQVPAPPKKIQRIFEAGHREEEEPRVENPQEELRAAIEQLQASVNAAALKDAEKEADADTAVIAPKVDAPQNPAPSVGARRAARTPFSTLASDPPFPSKSVAAPASASAEPVEASSDPEIVEKVVETVAALNLSTSASRMQQSSSPLGLGLGGPQLSGNSRTAPGESYRTARSDRRWFERFSHPSAEWLGAGSAGVAARADFIRVGNGGSARRAESRARRRRGEFWRASDRDSWCDAPKWSSDAAAKCGARAVAANRNY